MARFLSFEELKGGLIPTPELVSEVARDIMELNGCRFGSAIIFGSTAWGVHSWRSDIDVADTAQEGGGGEIRTQIFFHLEKKYGGDHGFLLDRYMIEILDSENENHRDGLYFFPEISPSTRDHFRLLAEVKGGHWESFYRRLKVVPSRSRSDDIRIYLERVEWLSQNLLRTRGDLSETWVSWNTTRMLQALENFPKQLARKILGKENKLPCPDTVANVLAEFSKLNFDWAGEVIKDFDRFLKISNFYRILVDQKKGREDYSEEKYMKDILGFFTDIPESISRICDTVRREYLRIQ